MDLSGATWHKSSYSAGDGGDCLEIARWRKSTHSDASGGNCLEVADGHPTVIPVRDSKNPQGPKLVFHTASWSAFIDEVKAS
ncbi:MULTISPECIES: DUF397 domain-containing protein [Streptomyces]|uniref:DUF397 domain-containing protein n=1 Tax=Streptomyces TaxID=1883 RepID=UPI001E52602C|nr:MULTISPECIES: DUF397 domain-containing protein [Streptomyces]UFQ16492.1 DUF397 domain-containing protein [Streptomyces huasconensis]WCL86094.1 DUF397 domain-containing protein [Streptomyces sp. JCM 35825]